MLRHYGVDLLDWHRGRLTSRRLSVLVRHLPRDSTLHRELYGEGAEWSVTDHLLAAVVDRLAESNWMFATVHRDEDSEPLDPPQPLQRPGMDTQPDQDPERPSLADLADFFS
ncbi:hypothetical protein ACWGKW_29750 [Streptomyces sp. NPDC054766]